MEDFSDFIETVLNEVSGKHAWDWIAKISQYNRLRGTQEYHEIVEKVIKELNKYGLDEVKLHKYSADGKSKTWEWVAAPAWEVRSGELWLTEPNKESLCRFNDTPMCIVGYSKSCNVTAELIDVGTGVSEDDYKDKDVKGKIVLMSAPKLMIPPQYAVKGALGVIVYPNPEKAAGYHDMTNYNRFATKLEILEKNTFGFSITHEKALYLKELLKKGPVKVEANIDARIFEGELEVISAAIHGTDNTQEEIILTAHLCHPAPGANDNASGSAGLIELVRALTTLIQKKLISPPKRTLRLLWIPEFEGMWPWAKENENKVRKALINLNLDMIGEHPIKIGEPFEICNAPYSTPSILNDVLRYFTEIIADHPKGLAINGTKIPMKYRLIPFAGGSDHQVFVDTAIGIPGIMLNHSDPLWHTSLDTIQNCDSTELKRIIGIALCIAYLFASLNGNDLFNFIPILEEGYYQRLGKTKKILMKLFNKIHTNGNSVNSNKKQISKEEKAMFGLAIIEASFHHERDVLEHLKTFEPYSSQELEYISAKHIELQEWTKNQKELWIKLCLDAGVDVTSISEPEVFNIKWSRSFLGLPNFAEIFPIALSKQFEEIKVPEPPELWFGDLHELMNLVGLSLNLKMVCAILSLEYQHFFFPSKVNSFLKFLERKDFVKKLK